MTQTLQIECETLVCACDIIAEAGQTLLIYNGLCVGVAGPAAPVAKVPPQGGQSLMALARPVLYELILAQLTKHPKATTRELSKLLGAPAASPSACRVGDCVRSLRAEGRVKACSESRYPQWIVA